MDKWESDSGRERRKLVSSIYSRETSVVLVTHLQRGRDFPVHQRADEQAAGDDERLMVHMHYFYGGWPVSHC